MELALEFSVKLVSLRFVSTFTISGIFFQVSLNGKKLQESLKFELE